MEKTETTAAPAPQAEPDLASLRTALELPDDAGEANIIKGLIGVTAGLRNAIVEIQGQYKQLSEKYDALLADAMENEKTLANRDLDAYGEVIAPEQREFWAGQILANRAATIAVLDGLKAKLAVPPTGPVAEPPPSATPTPAPVPLANRRAGSVTTVADLAAPAPAVHADRAQAIRNRAHQLRADKKLSWASAWDLATKELSKE